MDVKYAGVVVDDRVADGSDNYAAGGDDHYFHNNDQDMIRRKRVTVATTGSTEPLSAFSIGRRGNQTRRMVMKLSFISYNILTPGTYNIIDDHHNDNDNGGEEEELSMVRLTIPMMPQFQFCCNFIFSLIFRNGELRRHGLLPRLGLERLEL